MTQSPSLTTLTLMMILETLGQSTYRVLSHKAQLQSLTLSYSYQRLAVNERLTFQKIHRFVQSKFYRQPIRYNILRLIATPFFISIYWSSHFFFLLTPQTILLKSLKKVLRQQRFRIWHNRFHQSNETFWQEMLEHEELQYKTLEME